MTNAAIQLRARRSAFTLLETALAVVVGSLVVVSAAGLFGVLDRGDRGLAIRTKESSELANLHLVLQRTFSSLLVDERPPPPRNLQSAESQEEDPESVPAAKPWEVPADEPPRLSLRPDRTTGLPSVEFVVDQWPMPTRAVRRASEEEVDEQPEEGAAQTQSVAALRALRGVFLLREEERLDPEAPLTYALWLAPLPRPVSGGGGVEEPPDWAEPLRLATGITALDWRMFDDKTFREQMDVWRYDQLPGFVQVEIRTSSGLNARWLLEVIAEKGLEVPELAASTDSTPGRENTGDSSGGDTGNASRSGQPGGGSGGSKKVESKGPPK